MHTTPDQVQENAVLLQTAFSEKSQSVCPRTRLTEINSRFQTNSDCHGGCRINAAQVEFWQAFFLVLTCFQERLSHADLNPNVLQPANEVPL